MFATSYLIAAAAAAGLRFCSNMFWTNGGVIEMLFRCLQLLSARKLLPLPRVALLALFARAARHHIGDHFTLSSCLPACIAFSLCLKIQFVCFGIYCISTTPLLMPLLFRQRLDFFGGILRFVCDCRM